jgi:hypothetical protein
LHSRRVWLSRKHQAFAELLLIREPERRFYRECRLAGFAVAVYDESNGGERWKKVGRMKDEG